MLLPLGPLQIDNQTDCSVLGSLRVAAEDLRYCSLPRVAHVLDLDPVATSNYLHERPCIAEKILIWLAQAMRNLVEEAVQRV
jgi:hypothetical protein